MAAAVVADGRADLLGHDADVAQQLVDRLRLQLGCFLERLVQVGDVRLVMLAVMDFHRLLVDVRLEGIGGIGQGGKRKGHEALLVKKKRIDSLLDESMRSRAVFVQCFCSSGTTIRLCTFPSSSPSSTHSRWFGDTRNIVEHRQPMGSSDITVLSGCICCASRFTRCSSVPTAQMEPGGLRHLPDDVLGGPAVVGRLDDVPRDLRMHDHAHAGVLLAHAGNLGGGKSLMHGAMALPENHPGGLKLSGDRSPPSSCGFQTTIRSSGMPIL